MSDEKVDIVLELYLVAWNREKSTWPMHERVQDSGSSMSTSS